MQQVGKRTIGCGNRGSCYSGADHSNQIKYSPYVIGPHTKRAKFEFQIKK